MSKIDAKTFKPTKEEEAILDACFRGNIQCLGVAIVNYGRALFGEENKAAVLKLPMLRDMLERISSDSVWCSDSQLEKTWAELDAAEGRALFAPAASKTESTDPDCNPHDHSWSYGYCHTCHLMGRPEPASEPEKVETADEIHIRYHGVGCKCEWKPFTACQPAPSKPAAPVGEMPEEVSTALKSMRFTASNHRISDAETKGLLDNADKLESWWRTRAQPEPAAPEMPVAVRNALGLLPWWEGHALGEWWRTHAQPVANVAMTEELERILNYAEGAARFNTWSPPDSKLMVADCAAVREQAIAPKRLEKVRIALDTMRAHFEPNCQGQCRFPMVWTFCQEALAELDAFERGE